MSEKCLEFQNLLAICYIFWFTKFLLCRSANGMKFSTFDRDNDRLEKENCASKYRAGWWHNNCYESLLTGVHGERKMKNNGCFLFGFRVGFGNICDNLGIHWKGIAFVNRKSWESLKAVEMSVY